MVRVRMTSTRVVEKLDEMEKLLLTPLQEAQHEISGYMPGVQLMETWATRYIKRITKFGNYGSAQFKRTQELQWHSIYESLMRRKKGAEFDKQEFDERCATLETAGDSLSIVNYKTLKETALDRNPILVEYMLLVIYWSQYRSSGKRVAVDLKRQKELESKIARLEQELTPLREELALINQKLMNEEETENFEQSRN